MLRRFVMLLIAVVIGALTVLWGGSSAGASYSEWTVSENGGTVSPAAAGFPGASFTTDSNNPTAASGATTFLGASTPFGQEYGSSQGRSYFLGRTASGAAPSTTTVTFANPTPSDLWGFAVGDIDVDSVHISATNHLGRPLSAAELGFQSSFNFCTNRPKPSTCTGSGPFTDVPNWDQATATLSGNGVDTNGATGWFRPTAPVKTLTIVFTRASGIPAYQLWIAAKSRTISGTVDRPESEGESIPLPPGIVIELDYPDGKPVRDSNGKPITTTPRPDGSFTIPDVACGKYQLEANAPEGYQITPLRQLVDVCKGEVGDLRLRFTVTGGGGWLADTGRRNPMLVLVVGAIVLGAGAVLTLVGRRRT